jgi:tripartite-type tricarboxylate transporter receptor subunit TctC
MLALERKSNTRFLHVPFAGSAQVKQNLLSRAIPVAVMNVAEGVIEMRQGVLRPLAQMGETRWQPLAEVPTLRELGFDVIEGSMRGMAAPAGMPPAVLDRLALSVRRTVEDPEFQAAAVQQNLPLRFLGPAEYAAELRALQARYQALWAEHPWRES